MKLNSHHIATGKRGERLAEEYLLKKSYCFVERNFRTRKGELDLIMYDRQILVFIEVKAGYTSVSGTPSSKVGFQKVVKIQKMAQIYCSQKDLLDEEIRFDVIAIDLKQKEYKIEHIENAFIPNQNGYYSL